MAHTVTRLPRGADAQLGYKVESVHGTPVTVDSFIRHIPPTGLKPRIGRFESAAAVPGLVTRQSSGDVLYNDGGEGSLAFEVTRKGIGKLLGWMVGGTPGATQQGGTTAYLHTFEPGSMQAAGTSLTIQEGLVTYAGAIEPVTYAGCKCASFELSGDPSSIVTASCEVDAQSYTHATDLAAYSAPAEHVPYVWTNAAVVKRATAALPAVRSWKFSCANSIASDTRYMDGTGKRIEAVEAAYRDVKLELDVDLADLSKTFDDMVSDTGRAWVVEYVGGVADSAYSYTLRITIPDGYIVSDPPEGAPADGPSTQSIVVEARSNGTNLPYKIEVIDVSATL